ncbi:MAG TPA: hypothetical protein VJM74_02205 [Nitrososphaeraceae archaeon]|nr:hypothetical protein [Nitrososphaeraceae archaeon]
MKNRAKCRLCNSIIESFHQHDIVMCKCGEIQVEGGDSLKCAAKDWNNFLRVDDLGNEIIVKVDSKTSQSQAESLSSHKPDKDELLKMLDEMIKSYERLPNQAMLQPVSNYDLASALLLISSIFRTQSGR